ncbi:MAG: hypothetical protein HYS80_02460 [Candidatus Aenigmarchaeota archaeon]|nr:hypothetical protein [Candidatus Aenigmarchaeota archaeon]
MKLSKQKISFVLKNFGIGLGTASLIYGVTNSFDIRVYSLLFLALSFIVSNWLWKK